MRALLLLTLIGCAEPTNPNSITWSVGMSDSRGVPDPVVCTDVISHPCPLRLYAHTLTINGDMTATWGQFEGGHDANGKRAEDIPAIIEPITIDPALGQITFAQVGDDGGLRRTFTLSDTDTPVTWVLFNVPGNTTFHLSRLPDESH